MTIIIFYQWKPKKDLRKPSPSDPSPTPTIFILPPKPTIRVLPPNPTPSL